MKFAVVTLGCDKNTVDSERYVAELRAQEDPAWWVAHQERAHDIDRRIRERRA